MIGLAPSLDLLLSPSGSSSAKLASRLPGKGPSDPSTTDDPAVPGVLAQISDAAQSLFAQMRQQGISSESFDVHLDLRQLGLSIGANGNRSLEGHSLSVDLHVDAQAQGKLDVSFSVEETWVKASEAGGDAAQGGDAKAGGNAISASDAKTDGERAAKGPVASLVDGLKSLLDLLGKGQHDGLDGLLAQIGKALESLAVRRSSDAVKPDQGQNQQSDATQLQGLELQTRVHIHALSFEQSVQMDSPPADSPEPGSAQGDTPQAHSPTT